MKKVPIRALTDEEIALSIRERNFTKNKRLKIVNFLEKIGKFEDHFNAIMELKSIKYKDNWDHEMYLVCKGAIEMAKRW